MAPSNRHLLRRPDCNLFQSAFTNGLRRGSRHPYAIGAEADARRCSPAPIYDLGPGLNLLDEGIDRYRYRTRCDGGQMSIHYLQGCGSSGTQQKQMQILALTE